MGNRIQLEKDVGNNDMVTKTEEEESYRQTMHIEKGIRTDELNKHRHERDLKQLEEFRDYKQAELDNLKAERDKTHAEYMAMQELQKLIQEADQYAAEIEEMNVDATYKQLIIKVLDEGNETLTSEKDEMDQAKKKTDEENEELEKTLKATEERKQK